MSRDRDGDGIAHVDEVADQQECDACPHCNDTCFDMNCESCHEKRRTINEREHDQQSCSLLPSPPQPLSQSARTSTRTTLSTPFILPSAPSSFNVVSNQRRVRKRYYTMCEISRHNGSNNSSRKSNDPQTATRVSTVDDDNNAGGAAVQSGTLSPSSTSRTPPSLWIVAGNKVYDVTEYIQYHPGGPHCFFGKRAGGHQDSMRDLQYHSKLGQRLWNKFHIGYVTKKCSSSSGPVIQNNNNTSSSVLLQQPTSTNQWNFQFPSLW